jgi:adenylosuccinate lyase
MHERLRQHSLAAWSAVQAGAPNPLVELLAGDPELQAYLPQEEIRALMDASRHVGDAPQRANALAALVRSTFE